MKIGGKQVRNSEFVQNTRICHTLQSIILKKLDISLSVFKKKIIVMKIGGKIRRRPSIRLMANK